MTNEDGLRQALKQIEDYARTSYVECAMVDRRQAKRLQEIVNMSRRAIKEYSRGV